MNSPIELGAVFANERSDQPVRVIAFGNDVVMYDIWWPSKNSWALGTSSRAMTYFRTTTSVFLAQWSRVRMDEYTEAEFELHRPDLPFSFAQFSTIQWYDAMPETTTQVNAILTVTSESRRSNGPPRFLSAPRVFLAPFGPKDGSKPATLVEAEDGKGFTEAELLRSAWRLQQPHLRETRLTSGVGLYRAGLQKRIPSYYIWGSRSR